AELSLRVDRGLDPTGFRWSAALALDGAAGTHVFARPAVTARLGTPLPGPFLGSLELAAGTVLGHAPVQRLWVLGGPAAARGYPPSTVAGTAFWRGRLEAGTAFPGARVALFGDAGWAGDRDRIETDPSLVGAGIGVSVLDGLVRFDVARALRAPTGWRLHLYVDAA